MRKYIDKVKKCFKEFSIIFAIILLFPIFIYISGIVVISLYICMIVGLVEIAVFVFTLGKYQSIF
jgi:hypothetical protein